MPDKKLVVIGNGEDLAYIRTIAKKNVTVLGYQEDEVLVDYMQRAKAFVFAAIEDFGITPVEAQACGTPVICLGKGGTAESVIDGITGVHFYKQTVEAINDAVEKFEKIYKNFNLELIRKHSYKFSKSRFEEEFKTYINRLK